MVLPPLFSDFSPDFFSEDRFGYYGFIRLSRPMESFFKLKVFTDLILCHTIIKTGQNIGAVIVY